MKRRILFSALAVALVAMVGCSKDEPVENFSPENAIQFGTYVGRNASTRATVVDVAKLATDAFGVFAYYTGTANFTGDEAPNFMNNQKVNSSNNGTTWTYSPLKYWPNNEGDKVTFLAYAPYHDNVKVNTGATTIAYTVDTDVLKQEDLLYLDQNTSKTTDMLKPGVNDKVRFYFAHALSRIGYTAELMVDSVNGDATGDEDDDTTTDLGDLDENTTITINSVKLIGKFDKQAILNLNGGVWSDVAAATDDVTYELNSTNDNLNNLKNNVFTGNSNDKNDDDVKQRPINEDNSYIMIIPQEMGTLDATTKKLAKAGTGIKIVVDYNVVTTDPKLDGEKIDINNVITSDEFYFNFVKGKAYTFKLHLGMTSVKIEATMADWDEDTKDTAVNVPINKN